MRSLSLLLVLSLAACDAREAPSPVESLAARGEGVDRLVPVLEVLGLPADAVLREAVQIGAEGGWQVLRVPSFPSPGEPFRLLVVADSPRPAPTRAVLHATSTNWARQVDVPTTARLTPEGEPFFVWGPISLPRPVTARFAVEVQQSFGDTWLNNEGVDYTVPVGEPVAVSFAGDVLASQGGLTRPSGAELYEGHQLTLRADTYPQGAGVAAVVRWSVDGVEQPLVPMHIDQLNQGGFANNTRWQADLPTAELPRGSEVAWSIVVSSVGPEVTADDSGAPFAATVGAAPSVGYWTTGMYGFSQCHWDGSNCTTGWAWLSPLQEPLVVTPSTYQAHALAPYPAVEIYVAGVTDAWMDPSLLDLIEVEVYSPFFSGTPSGSWGSIAMSYRERSGNNLRYDWLPRIYQAPTSPAVGVQCPEDGVYPYVFRVSTDGGRSFDEIGDGTHPLRGADRTMVWQRFRQAPGVTVSPAAGPDLVPTAVGATSTALLELINTGNEPLALSGFEIDAPEFEMSWAGCASGDCEVRLESGERLTAEVRFRPVVAGAYDATLTWLQDLPEGCATTSAGSVGLVAQSL